MSDNKMEKGALHELVDEAVIIVVFWQVLLLEETTDRVLANSQKVAF